MKQIGRNCCREFFGFDPHVVAEYGTWDTELDESEGLEEEGGFGVSSAFAYNLEEFLAFTVQSVREDGWVPKSGVSPTAYKVDFMLNTKQYVPPSDDDMDKAKEIIEWGRKHITKKPHISDYEHNLSIILEQGYVLFKQIGLAASIVLYVKKEKGEEIKRQKEQQSIHIGTLGNRETFDLVYVTDFGFHTDWGYTYIYKFADLEGNVVVWKTSKDLDLNQGSQYKVTGKVVKHDIYRNVKQTSLNRCKVVCA